MTTERWARVKELFHAALEMAEVDRLAFLAERCGADRELQEQVAGLLRRHRPEDQTPTDADAITETTATETFLGGEPFFFKDPTSIGAYSVKELLGEGGMGVVYLAERQEPIHQRVAIKLIKPGMDSRRIMARFQTERQTLALMEHPNIARMMDAGLTAEHRPFFVMEYVPGEPITKFCDHRKLGIVERLHLFMQVCQAINHAHQKGIIHRDLKPSNILVIEQDGKPTAKVIDFGIAKAMGSGLTSQTLPTREGILLGTPEYMSPEQAAGGVEGVDTRSDIYSLGVVLYELLVGMVPFAASELRQAGLEGVARLLQDAPTPRPSTKLRALGLRAEVVAHRRATEMHSLAGKLARELEWIPLKALRKEPDQRYRSVADLADDITRYLNGEPLKAGPESGWYRARKLLKRHRNKVAAGMMILLALVAMLIETSWGLHHARLAQKTIQAAHDQELEQRQLAEIEQYAATLELAQRLLSDPMGGPEVYRLLNTCNPALRGWEWQYLMRRCRPVTTTSPMTPFPLDITVPFPFLSSLPADAVQDASTLRVRLSPNECIASSGDGRIIAGLTVRAADHGFDITIYDVPGHKILGTFPAATPTPHGWSEVCGSSVECDVTGTWVAFLDPDSRVVVIAVDDQRRVFRSEASATSIAFDRRGTRLAIGLIGGELQVLELKSAVATQVARVAGSVGALAISDTGKYLACENQGALRLYEVATGQQIGFAAGASTSNKGAISTLEDAVETNLCRICFQNEGRSLVTLSRLASLVGTGNPLKIRLPVSGRVDTWSIGTPASGNALKHTGQYVTGTFVHDLQAPATYEALPGELQFSSLGTAAEYSATSGGGAVESLFLQCGGFSDLPFGRKDYSADFAEAAPNQMRLLRFIHGGQDVQILTGATLAIINVPTWRGFARVGHPLWKESVFRELLALSQDGRFVLDGSADPDSLVLWDAPHRQVIATLSGVAWKDRHAATLRPDGGILAVPAGRRMVFQAIPSMQQVGQTDDIGAPPYHCWFDPTGQYLFVNSDTHVLRRWDLQQQRWHDRQVEDVQTEPALQPSHDGQFILARRLYATQEASPGLIVLDADLRVRCALPQAEASLDVAALSPDGSLLVALAGSDRLMQYRVPSGERNAAFDGRILGGSRESLAYSPDGSRVVVSGNMVRVFDAHRGKQLAVLEDWRSDDTDLLHRASSIDARFSSDGLGLLAYTTTGFLYRFESGTMNTTAPAPPAEPAAASLPTLTAISDDNITGIGAICPTGETIAALTRQGQVRLVDKNATSRALIKLPQERIRSVAYARSGTRLLLGTELGNLVEWDPALGMIRSVHVARDPIVRAKYVPGTDLAVWGTGYSIFHDKSPQEPGGGVVNLLTGENAFTFSSSLNDGPENLDVASDGLRIALGDLTDRPHGIVILQRMPRPSMTLLRSDEVSQVVSVAFDPAGRAVAGGDEKGSIILWDSRTHQQMGALHGHTDRVASMAFNGQGSLLLSASADGSVRLWDVVAQSEIGRTSPIPGGHEDLAMTVGFPGNGNLIALLFPGGMRFCQNAGRQSIPLSGPPAQIKP